MINENMRSLGAKRSVIRELFEYGRGRKAEIGEENVYDFSLGNPSVSAPDRVNTTIGELIDNVESVRLHGYTSAEGDRGVREAIAEHINRTFAEEVHAECIYMTAGAAAALTVTLKALVCPNEEVIVTAPYFPEYKVFVEACGGRLITVNARDKDFSLDVEAIRRAIGPRTAALIINSPNNPTGAVYGEDEIAELGAVLREESARLGRTIYLISDEPYRELAYDGVRVPYVTRYYDDSIVCYSFSKSLSIPGERIGYALICPRMNDFASVREAVLGAGRALGYVCAPSLLQYTIKECLGMSADIKVYEKNRDILTKALTEYGYEVVMPRGAFYLFVRSPDGSGESFSEKAKRKNILVVPSEDFGISGYVRFSYCVDTEMILRSLPEFKKLIEEYGK